MNPNPVFIIRHLRNTYGGTISYKGDCLYVDVNGDKFRVNLTDKKRFGYYTFFHRDASPRDGVYHFHSQLKIKDLSRGLFMVWCHNFNKELNIWSTDEDWCAFVNDAYRYSASSKKQYETIQNLCEGKEEVIY